MASERARERQSHPLEPATLDARFDINARFAEQEQREDAQRLAILEDDVYRAVPWRQCEVVRVEMPGTAHVNIDISHKLRPPKPTDVKWIVVGWEFTSTPASAPFLYRDTSPTAKPWTSSTITLRSNMTTGVVYIQVSVPSA